MSEFRRVERDREPGGASAFYGLLLARAAAIVLFGERPSLLAFIGIVGIIALALG